jgi:hypothetical protein
MRKTSTIDKDPPKRIFNCTDVLIIGTARIHIHPFDADAGFFSNIISDPDLEGQD